MDLLAKILLLVAELCFGAIFFSYLARAVTPKAGFSEQKG